jgi:hypothetical protein
MYNQITSTVLMIGALVLLFGWIWWLSTRPENKGKQWGVALIQDLVKKHVSYLMGFVLVTNLASAGIAAAISGEHSNPAARMVTHFAIFAVSVFGAFSLLPSWRMAFSKEKISPGRRAARLMALAIIFGFAVVAPIANMYLIAHSLKQVPHLNLFFMNMNIFLSDDVYITALINSGIELPDNIRAYSPFQGMETILAAEIVVLVLGMSVLFVEVLTAPDNHVRTIEQIEEEAAEDKKKEEKKDDKKKEEEKPTENALASNFTKILAFCNIPYTELIIKNAVNTVEEFSTEDQFTFSNELDDLYANVVKHTSLKTQAEKDKNLEVTEKGIREIFARSKKNLGIGQQLKARKK